MNRAWAQGRGRPRSGTHCAPPRRQRYTAAVKLSRIIINGVALIAAALIVPGMHLEWKNGTVQTLITLVVLAVVFGIINAYIRPVLRAVSLPINLVSMGLFGFFLNAGLLLLLAWVVDKVWQPVLHIGDFPPNVSAEHDRRPSPARSSSPWCPPSCRYWCPMAERQLVSSGSPYEPVIGFSRAVRVGDRVMVSGTGPIWPDGTVDPDPAVQATRCLTIILEALAAAGAVAADVVRTRMFLVDAADWEAVGQAHGAVFGDIRPAATMVVVAALLDDRWRVEIEAEAIIGPRRR